MKAHQISLSKHYYQLSTKASYNNTYWEQWSWFYLFLAESGER